MAAPLTVVQRIAPVRGPLARACIAAWALFQIVVVATVPAIDAQAGHADQVVAHWEDSSDTSCPPLHDTSACQLCQQVTASGSSPAVRPLLPLAVEVGEAPTAAGRQRALRPVALAIPSTRAPPIA
jgi:hypothetical protein